MCSLPRLASFPSYSVLDRTRRQRDKEISSSVFVCSAVVHRSGSRVSCTQSPTRTSSTTTSRVGSARGPSPNARQELHGEREGLRSSSPVSIVEKWSLEKRQEVDCLPVPSLNKAAGPSMTQPKVIILPIATTAPLTRD